MSSRAPILITGSAGVIGSALTDALEAIGETVVPLDLNARNRAHRGDVRNPEDVRRAISPCRGVIHLAAFSRVVWGERDPQLCRSTNVDGTRSVIDAAIASLRKPWVLFASSREVYGQAASLPATEETPLFPINEYGWSKVEGERIVQGAREAGLKASVMRLSNVYGSSSDHRNRVIPAFVRAAMRGDTLRVDGSDRTFDFTYIDDTIQGLVALIGLLDRKPAPPPIHLTSGVPTRLGDLAARVVDLARSNSRMIECAPQPFDCRHFHGDSQRAQSLIGWKARVTLREGLARFIQDLRNKTDFTRREATGS